MNKEIRKVGIIISSVLLIWPVLVTFVYAHILERGIRLPEVGSWSLDLWSGLIGSIVLAAMMVVPRKFDRKIKFVLPLLGVPLIWMLFMVWWFTLFITGASAFPLD